jgi:DNA-binding NtrC family response regulator
MNKIHILLIENRENEIEFFTEALKESGLSFLCNTARDTDQAFRILKNTAPDAVFIDAYMIKSEVPVIIKKIKSLQKVPVILYSAAAGKRAHQATGLTPLSYVQLPGSTRTMAHILKNLFIDNEIHDQPAVLL